VSYGSYFHGGEDVANRSISLARLLALLVFIDFSRLRALDATYKHCSSLILTFLINIIDNY